MKIKIKSLQTHISMFLVAGARLELRPPLADMRPTSGWNENKKRPAKMQTFFLVAGARLELTSAFGGYAPNERME
jgi:hypothetical protein